MRFAKSSFPISGRRLKSDVLSTSHSSPRAKACQRRPKVRLQLRRRRRLQLRRRNGPKRRPASLRQSAPKEQAKGQSAAGDFVFGARAGVVVPTQQILENVSSGTSVGPLVNLEGYYVLREWVRLGVMFEWHQFNVSTGDVKLGTLSTYSFLPTVEFRPTREMMREGLGFAWVIPYASLGAGVNVHSFSSATQLGNASVSFPSTGAFRVAGGLDFPITQNLALNTEIAWKRDSGTFEDNLGRESNFNASPLMFLFGLRVHF